MDIQVVTIAKLACSETIQRALDAVSTKTNAHPIHLAQHFNILHNHPPCTYSVNGCTFCEHNGNIFANIEKQVICSFETKVYEALDDLYKNTYADAIRKLNRDNQLDTP